MACSEKTSSRGGSSTTARRPGEDDDTFFARIFEDAIARDPTLQGRPFVDVLVSDLPADKTTRDGWRLAGGRVVVDPDAVEARRRQKVQEGLDASPHLVPLIEFLVERLNEVRTRPAQAFPPITPQDVRDFLITRPRPGPPPGGPPGGPPGPG